MNQSKGRRRGDGPPAKKRQKLQDARAISIQNTSTTFFTDDGNLNLEAFVNSRQYEIKSLLKSLQSSKTTNSTRAFQTLPRDLRRRTASHNAKRIPKRLRAKAVREMATDKTPALSDKKRRAKFKGRYRIKVACDLVKARSKDGSSKTKKKKLPIVLVKKKDFKRRQRLKTWLPTHIWTAKRAHMVTRWGYSLARSPVVKCMRPIYRASTLDGCAAWDTSYINTFTLTGSKDDVKRVFRELVQKDDDVYTSKTVLCGQRACETWVYKQNGFPSNAIAPVTVLYTVDDETRVVYLRVHPAAFKDVWKEFIAVIENLKLATAVKLKDLKSTIGSITLTGPHTPLVLSSLLAINEPITFTPFKTITHCHLSSIIRRNNNINKSQKPAGDDEHQILLGFTEYITANARSLQPPTIMYKHTLGISHSTNTTNNAITLVLPWVYVLPLWHLLMRTPNVRFGGLQEIEYITFERCEGVFPGDYPGCYIGSSTADMNDNMTLQQKVLTVGKKRKRTTSGGVDGDVEEIDVFCWPEVEGSGLPTDTTTATTTTEPSSSPSPAGLITTSKATKKKDSNKRLRPIWQIPPPLLSIFLSTPLSSLKSICKDIHDAVVTVHLDFASAGGGTTIRAARIYRIPYSSASSVEVIGEIDGIDRSKYQPDERDFIGYVIRSGYSMKLGRGCGIGVVKILGLMAAAAVDGDVLEKKKRDEVKRNGNGNGKRKGKGGMEGYVLVKGVDVVSVARWNIL